MASKQSLSATFGLILVFIVLQSEVGWAQQAFTVEPSDTRATEGSTATLRCVVTNKAGTIIWLKDGGPISAESTISDTSNTRYSIVGDGTSTFDLQIENADLADSGTFQCQVSPSGAGNDLLESNIATLTVVRVQQFEVEPDSTIVPLDTTATLECQVNNKEGFLYWLKDGVIISNDTLVTNGIARYSIGGDQSINQYNLVILSAQAAADEGQYQCVVSAAGTSERIESGVVTLSVKGKALATP
jgi:hypothetical protein